MDLDVQSLSILSGLVVPLLVGVLTKCNAPKWVKSVLNAGLSAAAGGLAVALEAKGHVQLGTWLAGIGQTWVVSVATYYGLWKPSGVGAAVEEKTASFGIGGDAGSSMPAGPVTDPLAPPPVSAAPHVLTADEVREVVLGALAEHFKPPAQEIKSDPVPFDRPSPPDRPARRTPRKAVRKPG